jgi:hypothetical protein
MPYPKVQTADFFSITPSTNGNTKFTAYAIYVGGTNGQGKDVNAMSSRGSAVLFKGVPVGTTLYAQFSAVRTTNTTANAVLVGFGPQ